MAHNYSGHPNLATKTTIILPFFLLSQKGIERRAKRRDKVRKFGSFGEEIFSKSINDLGSLIALLSQKRIYAMDTYLGTEAETYCT
jgi:hypothetical protein